MAMTQRRVRLCVGLGFILLYILSSFSLLNKADENETFEMSKNDFVRGSEESNTLGSDRNGTLNQQSGVDEGYVPATDFSLMQPIDPIRVPYPIFHVSLPKSGTTSIARYFYCGQVWTAHTFCNTVGTSHGINKQLRIGQCFLENVQAGRPPFFECGNYVVWSDTGHPRGTPCYYPSLHGLEEYYQAYPNSTILLITRNSTAWSESIMRWKSGDLLKKWHHCEHFPDYPSTVDELILFYEFHAQNIRNFVAWHPTLTYIEIDLEDADIAEKLQATIGIRASCLKHHNSHEKRLALNPRFRREFLKGEEQRKKAQQEAEEQRKKQQQPTP